MKKIPFHLSLMSTNLLIVSVSSVLILGLVLCVSRESGEDRARDQFESASLRAQERTLSQLALTYNAAKIGARVNEPTLPFLRALLESEPSFYSFYFGKENGDFFQIIKADKNGLVARTHEGPPETAFIVRQIFKPELDGDRIETWSYLAPDDRVLGERVVLDPPYDPRVRPWYTNPGKITEPYVFNSLQQPGITASEVLIDRSGVFGVDITLASLQSLVESQEISQNGGLGVFDKEGSILAVHPKVEEIFSGDSAWNLGQIPEGISFDGEWILGKQVWQVSETQRWTTVALAPLRDFMGPYLTLRSRIFYVTLGLLALALPLIGLISRSLTKVLSHLAQDAQKISEMDFSWNPVTSTPILEFYQLSEGFGRMKLVLSQKTDDLNATLAQLGKIIDLNIALAAESDIDRLSELILEGARELSGADAGSLYLHNEARTQLEFQIVHTQSLGFLQGGTSGNKVTLSPVDLYSSDGTPNQHNVVTACYHSGQTVNIHDAYNDKGFDFSGTKKFDQANNYRSQSFLTVPLRPRGGEVMGAMQLINSRNKETGEINSFSSNIQRFVEALAAGAATALSNRDLIETQRRLFEAMIQLLAGAIDAKSPYTGGHCERVPIVAMMLADKAEAEKEGPFGDFTFGTVDEKRAFRIGAWLHDAGKITTPDFVVDKSVKLETIYNRIHEIRTRFEVLLRDARITRHEKVLEGGDPAAADAEFEAIHQRLVEEFAFVAECNLGDEFLSDAKIARLKEIGAQTWTRFFDDSLGLSWEEASRLKSVRESTTEVVLPTERLLDDKPEQVIPRGPEFAHMYEAYNFALPVPKALYNRGELYNLAIRRGTLSEEERFKINEHVMQTIVMLDKMPFPRELRRVAEYAGTHHETLNGVGYPRRLTAENLSIPARIMAIADIFEALTASDRPYKKPKPLSAVVEILHHFKTDGHIDPDLFDLFLTSGVYKEYGVKYLRPEQVDEVDIMKFLG